jgi:hypothetical protein
MHFVRVSRDHRFESAGHSSSRMSLALSCPEAHDPAGWLLAGVRRLRTSIHWQGRRMRVSTVEAALTLIQIGDIHGRLLPRPNLRSNGTGRTEGGVRDVHLDPGIRAGHPNSVLVNPGATRSRAAPKPCTR